MRALERSKIKAYLSLLKQDGDFFDVYYGRVKSTRTHVRYPMSKWYSKKSEKERKGYVDVTDLHLAKVPVISNDIDEGFAPIAEKDIAELVDYLVSQARSVVAKNYSVESAGVTQAMIDRAQYLINDLLQARDVFAFNEGLLALFHTIPRRMDQVAAFLATEPKDFNRIILREQELLDVMAGQVVSQRNVIRTDSDKNETILEAMGLVIRPVTQKDISVIKGQLGSESSHLFYKAWKVENRKTQKAFNAFQRKKKCATKYFWHGSRTENWWGILGTGLVLRPTNVIINGKMFGHGLYFAPRAKKAIGYTSLRDAYWARGTSNYGFLALHEVAYGKPFDVRVYQSEYGRMDYQKLQKMCPGANCLHAHAGANLYNDEIIIYQEEQTTIRYLVELKTA